MANKQRAVGPYETRRFPIAGFYMAALTKNGKTYRYYHQSLLVAVWRVQKLAGER